MKVVNVATMSVDTARDGFLMWTRERQRSITTNAESREDAEAKLAAHLIKRYKLSEGFEIAYRTLALAGGKTDTSLHEALAEIDAEDQSEIDKRFPQ